jgi:restriction endonuclease Mrr
LSGRDAFSTVTTVLDDLSGYEFEDAVASLFRELGYDDVTVASRVADEGRDVTMDDGETAYVVECKHTGTVSRPVVQKLHSAVATYDHPGPKRGMVVTSGRFTGPAIEYAERLAEIGDPHPIELIDGRDLRELGESVGMDLYNGRIEIICETTLPVGEPTAALADVFADVENAPSPAALSDPDVGVTYRPIVDATAATRATFETSVGVIHRINRRDALVVDAAPPAPEIVPAETAELTDADPIALEAAKSEYGGETLRFERTESAYRDWIKERLGELLETTVSYTGGNNVTYTKECRPSPGDVSIDSIRPLYLPRVDAAVELGSYTHRYEYDAAGDRHAARTDAVRRCVHCGETDAEETYTYCENCGSVSCETHTESERLTGEPVCTGCSVTESFFFAEKHFFDEANRAEFREAYEAMPFYRKALENPRLVAGVAVAMLLGLFALLTVSL